MPPNNSNSTSTLSRQMQRLRVQVDRIDLELLKLLQQRIKLSRRIGETKRRHGAVIYVPQRERELLRRVDGLSRGKFPSRSVTAIYREILSSSRAAQGQGAIGLLRASASAILLPARWCFGACGEFVQKGAWSELAKGLGEKSLAIALLTGAELGRILATTRSREDFLSHFAVVNDFSRSLAAECPLAERIFIVTPRGGAADSETSRILVLIECKSNPDAVKSWLNSMPGHLIHADAHVLDQRSGAMRILARLSSAKVVQASDILEPLQRAGLAFSTLGTYGGSEDYAG